MLSQRELQQAAKERPAPTLSISSVVTPGFTSVPAKSSTCLGAVKDMSITTLKMVRRTIAGNCSARGRVCLLERTHPNP